MIEIMFERPIKNRFVFLLRLLFSSDDFIQAQQQLARWASEDVVSVVLEPGSDTMAGHGPTPHPSAIHGGTSMAATMATSMGLVAGNGGLLSVGPRDYYPSPPSTETESSGSVIPQPQPQPQPQPRHVHIDRGPDGEPLMETSGYPEYKH